jgi:hypothetical protein
MTTLDTLKQDTQGHLDRWMLLMVRTVLVELSHNRLQTTRTLISAEPWSTIDCNIYTQLDSEQQSTLTITYQTRGDSACRCRHFFCSWRIRVFHLGRTVSTRTAVAVAYCCNCNTTFKLGWVVRKLQSVLIERTCISQQSLVSENAVTQSRKVVTSYRSGTSMRL